MNNWSNKDSRRALALAHTADMKDRFNEAIMKSIEHTVVLNDNMPFYSDASHEKTLFLLEPVRTSDAIMKYSESKPLVLNFASYKNPGGKFIEGAIAQEEALCHSSFLYNVLCAFPDYYYWNRNHLNRGMYTNRAILTPDIFFFGDTQQSYVTCDVLSCAAPNKSLCIKYNCFSEEENREALKDRTGFIVNIARSRGYRTLILGAFGCGVFAQNPSEVATLFYDAISACNYFDTVIFAVPKNNMKNYKCFYDVITDTKNN